jgi:hypothetical protein
MFHDFFKAHEQLYDDPTESRVEVEVWRQFGRRDRLKGQH